MIDIGLPPSQSPQPHFEDSTTYRALRPTKLDKIKNFSHQVRRGIVARSPRYPRMTCSAQGLGHHQVGVELGASPGPHGSAQLFSPKPVSRASHFFRWARAILPTMLFRSPASRAEFRAAVISSDVAGTPPVLPCSPSPLLRRRLIGSYPIMASLRIPQ